jgi:hypothetical protein
MIDPDRAFWATATNGNLNVNGGVGYSSITGPLASLTSTPGMLETLCAHAHAHDCVGCPVSMPFRLTQGGAILFVTQTAVAHVDLSRCTKLMQ